MGGGGDYGDVGRWLRNLVTAHARREALGAEAVIDASGSREGRSYGVRVRVGDGTAPLPGEPPLELRYEEVAAGRGSLTWCAALAARVRELAGAAAAHQGARPSA